MIAASSGVARAQDAVEHPWRFAKVASPVIGGQWGLGLSLGLAYARTPLPGPAWIGGAIRAVGRYGFTTGSTQASLSFEAPGLSRDWRVLALVQTERLQRTPFFGLTNESPQDDSLRKQFGNLYYRYSLLRATGLGIVHRRLAGPFWLLAGGQVRHYRSTALKQRPSAFDAAVAGPAIPDTIRRNGTELRAGLLMDTRDDWAAATRGVLLEAVVAFGTLRAPVGESGLSYRRYLFGAREFLPVVRSGRTILALRQRVTLASDSLPFFLAYEQVTSWLPSDGIVGARTVRLHGGGRELASNHAMVTVEVRRKLMVPSDNPLRPGGLWGYAFADGALLWEPRTSASFDRNQWTVGAGLRLQSSPGSIVGLDVGWGDAGPHVALLTQFGF